MFSPYPPSLSIYLDSQPDAPTFTNKDQITGTLSLTPYDSNPFPYTKIEIQLIGLIHTKNQDYQKDFLHITKELSGQGKLLNQITLPFQFSNLPSPYESYHGENLLIDYRVQADLFYNSSLFTQQASTHQSFSAITPLDSFPGILSTVNETLEFNRNSQRVLLEFFLNKNKFNIHDFVEGQIKFIHVEMPIASIDLFLVKSEKINGNNNNYIIGKYEVCDGQPLEGDVIPIRMTLDNFEVSPTMSNINNIGWVKYYLKIVIYTDKNNKNFQLIKNIEILLYREKKEGDFIKF